MKWEQKASVRSFVKKKFADHTKFSSPLKKAHEVATTSYIANTKKLLLSFGLNCFEWIQQIVVVNIIVVYMW